MPTFVYELVHDGKTIYIGVSGNPEKRMHSHVMHSNLLPRPFSMNILAEFERRSSALEMERKIQLQTGVQRSARKREKKVYTPEKREQKLQSKRDRSSRIRDTIEGGCSVQDAADSMGISIRQTRRLYKYAKKNSYTLVRRALSHDTAN